MKPRCASNNTVLDPVDQNPSEMLFLVLFWMQGVMNK